MQHHVKHPSQEREVIERTEISQGKLHIGCRTNTTFAADDYIALQVAMEYLEDFLILNYFAKYVEKESLAYYVSSNIESHIGLMMIMLG